MAPPALSPAASGSRTPASATAARWPLRRGINSISISTRARARRPLEPAAAASAAANAPAAAAADAAAANAANAQPLGSWCRANGAFVHGSVDLVYSPDGGRTLTATNPVKAGERLAVIPLRLCVVASTAAAEGADPSWGWQWRSAAALLRHALLSDDQLRRGYLPHLPGWSPDVPPLPQVPLLWIDAELRELQGCLPAALPATTEKEEETHADRRRRFAREVLLTQPELKAALEREAAAAGGNNGAGAALEAAAERLTAWALAVVTSRSFGLSPSSGGGAAAGHAMVPLVDMADHVPPDQGPSAEVAALLEGEEEGSGNGGSATAPATAPTATAIVLKATRDLNPGDPITITYGQHGPADTLLSYGFVSSAIDGAPGPPFQMAWDGGALLLAAFEALVAEGGPGVQDARDLPSWQRRALEALFSRSEAQVLAGEAGDQAANKATTTNKKKKAGGFGGGGGGKQAKAAEAAPAATATLRLGGDPEHSVDARLAGAARLLALSKQDAGVAAALKAMVAGAGDGDALLKGLAALCAPPMAGGGGGSFPVSPAHEAVAARALAGFTALAYRRAFKTTIQDDERLLKGLVAETREAVAAAAPSDSSSSSSPSLLPPSLGQTTPRDRLERRELALRYRLATKRELEKVAQAVGAHMKRALGACG